MMIDEPPTGYTHPHPDPAHILRVYRGHILGSKRKWRTARGLIHYRELIEIYLAAKREARRQRMLFELRPEG
jgi:hypothetical protein